MRSLARRGNLGREDCYCEPEELRAFLEAQALLPEAGARVLVVGCGTSGLTAGLASNGGIVSAPTFEVTAIDSSATAIEWMTEQHPDIEWCVANAAAMDSRWVGRFAVVLDKGVIGAASTDDAAASAAKFNGGDLNAPFVVPRGSAYLSEYRRVLSLGGWVVVVMPEQAPWLNNETSMTNTWIDHRIGSVSGGIVYAFRAPLSIGESAVGEPCQSGCAQACLTTTFGVPMSVDGYDLKELD